MFLAVNEFHWFGRDSYLEVVLPDMRVEVIPAVCAGRHIQGTKLQPMAPQAYGPVFSSSFLPSKPISHRLHAARRKQLRSSKGRKPHTVTPDSEDSGADKSQDRQGSPEYQDYIRSRMPPEAIAHLGAAEAFVACAALRYIADKTHDHLKTSYIYIDNLSLIERPVEFLVCRTSNVSRREYPANTSIQTPLPSFLIIPRRLPNSKLTVALAQADHHTALQSRLDQISQTTYRDIVEDPTIRLDDHWRSNTPASPFFLPIHACRRAFAPPPYRLEGFHSDINSAKFASWTRVDLERPADSQECKPEKKMSKFMCWGRSKSPEEVEVSRTMIQGTQ